MRASRSDWALFILRIGAGVTFILTGYPKLLHAGHIGFVRYLQVRHFPSPPFFAWLMALVEFLGGLAILAGVQVKWAGGVLAIERFLIILVLRLTAGGFLSARGGWALDFLLLCMVAATALIGPGAITAESVWRMRPRGS